MHTSPKQESDGIAARLVPLPGSASMPGWLTAIALFVFTSLAYAQDEGEAISAPAETVHIVWVIVFLVIFFGMIIGYFVFVWLADRKSKRSEIETGKREPPLS